MEKKKKSETFSSSSETTMADMEIRRSGRKRKLKQFDDYEVDLPTVKDIKPTVLRERVEKKMKVQDPKRKRIAASDVIKQVSSSSSKTESAIKQEQSCKALSANENSVKNKFSLEINKICSASTISEKIPKKKQRRSKAKPRKLDFSNDFSPLLSDQARTGHILYKCISSGCSESFCNLKNLELHKKQIHGESVRHVCTECEKCFSTSFMLRSHIRMEHSDIESITFEIRNVDIVMDDKDDTVGEKISICTRCGYRYGNREDPEHECEPAELRYFCPCCDFESLLDVDIQLHLSENHKGEYRDIKDKDKYVDLRSSSREPAWTVGQNKTKCELCDLQFEATGDLKQHMNIKHAHLPFACGMCKICYGRKTALKKHMLSHRKTDLKCDVCNKEFIEKSRLEAHLLTHTGEKPHQCEVCGNRYYDEKAVRKHILMKHPENPNSRVNTKAKTQGNSTASSTAVCHLCGKAFKSLSLLNKHLKIHRKLEIYKCPNCELTFDEVSTFKQHKLSHQTLDFSKAGHIKSIPNKSMQEVFKEIIEYEEGHQSGSPYQCSICNKRFNKVKFVHRHIRIIHMKEEDKKYICRICKRGFTMSAALRTHMRLHTKSKPFQCKICNKQFRQLGHVKDHLLHHGKPHLKCALCKMMFKSRGSLRRHVKVHCKMLPFKCPVKDCVASFYTLYLFLAHLSTCLESVDVKTILKCSFCSEGFIKSAIESHYHIHEKDVKFPCGVCDATYDNYERLYFHKDEKGHFEESEYGPPANNNFVNRQNLKEYDCELNKEDLMTQYVYNEEDDDDGAEAVETLLEDNGATMYVEQSNINDDGELILIAEQLTYMASGVPYPEVIVQTTENIEDGTVTEITIEDVNVEQEVGQVQNVGQACDGHTYQAVFDGNNVRTVEHTEHTYDGNTHQVVFEGETIRTVENVEEAINGHTHQAIIDGNKVRTVQNMEQANDENTNQERFEAETEMIDGNNVRSVENTEQSIDGHTHEVLFDGETGSIVENVEPDPDRHTHQVMFVGETVKTEQNVEQTSVYQHDGPINVGKTKSIVQNSPKAHDGHITEDCQTGLEQADVGLNPEQISSHGRNAEQIGSNTERVITGLQVNQVGDAFQKGMQKYRQTTQNDEDASTKGMRKNIQTKQNVEDSSTKGMRKSIQTKQNVEDASTKGMQDNIISTQNVENESTEVKNEMKEHDKGTVNELDIVKSIADAKHNSLKLEDISGTSQDLQKSSTVTPGIQPTLCDDCKCEFPDEISLAEHGCCYKEELDTASMSDPEFQVVTKPKKKKKKKTKSIYTIKKPSYKLANSNDLSKHLKDVFRNGGVVYECKTNKCVKRFINFTKLSQHKKLVHKEILKHICNQCKKLFSNFFVLKSHIRMEHSDQESVPYIIKNTNVLIKDKTKKVGTEMLVCTKCGYRFGNLEHSVHDCKPMELHYYCPCCDYFSENQTEVGGHISENHDNDIKDKETIQRYVSLRSDIKEPGLLLSAGDTTCDACSITFDTNKELKQHMNSKHADHPFACGVCQTCYGRKTALTKHMRSHIKMDLKCHVCNKEFQEKVRLETHMLTHTGEKPHQCEVCGNRYCDEKSVRKHMMIKHLEHYKACYPDRVVGPNIGKRKVNKASSCVCHLCGKCYPTELKLNKHLKEHKIQDLYKCPDCELTFDEIMAFKKHRLTHQTLDLGTGGNVKGALEIIKEYKVYEDGHPSGLPHRCGLCNKRFSLAKRLHLHIRVTHLKEEDKGFACHVCKKGFTLSAALRTHMRMHIDTKPYKCRICNKQFRQLGHVKDHLLHHGKPHLKCALCQRMFKSKGNLCRHLRRHCKILPFQCPVNDCKAGFQSLFPFLTHCSECFESVDLNEMLACNFCDKSFTPGDLRSHYNSHENDVKFPCEKCIMNFKSYQHLYFHKEKHNHFAESEFEKPGNCRNDLTTDNDISQDLSSENLMNQYDYIEEEDCTIERLENIDEEEHNEVEQIIENERAVVLNGDQLKEITSRAASNEKAIVLNVDQLKQITSGPASNERTVVLNVNQLNEITSGAASNERTVVLNVNQLSKITTEVDPKEVILEEWQTDLKTEEVVISEDIKSDADNVTQISIAGMAGEGESTASQDDISAVQELLNSVGTFEEGSQVIAISKPSGTEEVTYYILTVDQAQT